MENWRVGNKEQSAQRAQLEEAVQYPQYRKWANSLPNSVAWDFQISCKNGSCIMLFKNQDTDLKVLRASKLAFVMTSSICCDFWIAKWVPVICQLHDVQQLWHLNLKRTSPLCALQASGHCLNFPWIVWGNYIITISELFWKKELFWKQGSLWWLKPLQIFILDSYIF